MLKNFNDYISLLVLIFMAVIGLSLFVWAIAPFEDRQNISDSRVILLKEYLDNEEE